MKPLTRHILILVALLLAALGGALIIAAVSPTSGLATETRMWYSIGGDMALLAAGFLFGISSK